MSSDVGDQGFGVLPAGFWYDREKEGLYAFIEGDSLRYALDDLEAYFDVDIDQLITSRPLLLEVLQEYGSTTGDGGWVEAGNEFLEEILGLDGATLFKADEPCLPPPEPPRPPGPIRRIGVRAHLV